MSSIRKKDEYVESDINQFFSLSTWEISGRTASWIIYGLESYLRRPLLYIMRKLSNFDSILSLEIEDSPTEFPIYPFMFHSENATDSSKSEESKIQLNNININELKGLFEKHESWPYLTIEDYHNAYLQKTVTPSTVAETLIKLCKNKEIEEYNAIVEINEKKLLEAAAESTKRYESGISISIVDGVPFFVKEHIKLMNYSVYGGIYGYSGHRSKANAHCIQKLLDAGALLVGTTTMPLLGCNPFGVNPTAQNRSVKNIWDGSRYAGGSSSGSGIVVGLGLCPFAIGSDSLGSIRIPSAHCGIVGLRPTFGRISISDCTTHYNNDAYMVVGPMACCLTDAAIVYYFMAGADKKYTHGHNQPILKLPDIKSFQISKIRFGIFPKYINVADPLKISQILEVCRYLKELGCSETGINIPEIYESTISSYCQMIMYLSCIADDIEKRGMKNMMNDINIQISKALANTFQKENLHKILRQRTRSMKIMESIFEEVDVIIMPTTGRYPPQITQYHSDYGFYDQNELAHQTHFCIVSSFCGLPSISINIGYNKENGLPLACQLIAKWWNEELLFLVANAIERKFPLTKTPVDFQKIF